MMSNNSYIPNKPARILYGHFKSWSMDDHANAIAELLREKHREGMELEWVTFDDKGGTESVLRFIMPNGKRENFIPEFIREEVTA